MSQNVSQEIIDLLSKSGIIFTLTVPIPYGTTQINLDKNLVSEYVLDKYLALAKYYGVSKSEYVLWLQQNMSVICCGTTKQGKRCKKTVKDGNHVDIQQWIKMQGLVCELHESELK
ncbi:hypothetical protein P7L54_19850 [Acinetobacter bereziniae]|uniref:Uncharacterized protein n=1 Tax=Acinetobacter bereziniae LMG 1003 = CIP 70.12 TaxID=981324 RepID=N9D0A7_ACIBZ|nr:hypothetical protein [Acinetobacter bereziniae]ENV91316.1 hypothetical protein F938_03820 [Acinetobacter bereziniae LMG 1003 = CIP 70.12]MBJ9907543.1 hypothetical protein [Acinetobacter bereziniae]MBJ9930162.1 hypothetical protein [Acinetobacter bereziniae]MDG3558198.1 hypothetical protein [Acinetobacter bereziniae]MDP6000961.1 hypothetical protein [Acinetobacter bereziniae]